MDWDSFIAGICWSVTIAIWIVWFALKRYDVTRKPPYHWACTECSFRVSSPKDPVLVLQITEHHKAQHT